MKCRDASRKHAPMPMKRSVRNRPDLTSIGAIVIIVQQLAATISAIIVILQQLAATISAVIIIPQQLATTICAVIIILQQLATTICAIIVILQQLAACTRTERCQKPVSFGLSITQTSPVHPPANANVDLAKHSAPLNGLDEATAAQLTCVLHSTLQTASSMATEGETEEAVKTCLRRLQ